MKPNIDTILKSAPNNLSIIDTITKARSVLEQHRQPYASISGGADSDIVLDLLELVKPDGYKIAYAFYDTSMEYKATTRHLDELETKYGITIERRKAKIPVAAAVREYGLPFISKDVSEMIGRLQKHNFDWNDTQENATEEKYGKCKSALDWYFDRRPRSRSGNTRYSIKRLKRLKEFMQQYTPDFLISDKCCDYAKKNTAHDFLKEHPFDLEINGMRGAEGGRRAGSITTCFSPNTTNRPDNYRPIWFWSDKDKAAYKEWRGIRYSDCYEVYGLTRVGCAGCPLNSKAEQDIALVEPFEPKIVKAARNIFNKSYDYKRKYIAFKNNKQFSGQLSYLPEYEFGSIEQHTGGK